MLWCFRGWGRHKSLYHAWDDGVYSSGNLGLLPKQSKVYTGAVDVWALGCLVHEILTTEMPFLGDLNSPVCSGINTSKPVTDDTNEDRRKSIGADAAIYIRIYGGRMVSPALGKYPTRGQRQQA